MGWRWVSQGALFEIFASVGAWGRERGRCTGSLSLPPYPPPAPCSPDKSERIKSPLFFIRNSSVCLLYCNPFSLSCDIWGTNYNYDNWEPEFMTIFVTWHLRVTLDSIRNSCHVSPWRCDAGGFWHLNIGTVAIVFAQPSTVLGITRTLPLSAISRTRSRKLQQLPKADGFQDHQHHHHHYNYFCFTDYFAMFLSDPGVPGPIFVSGCPPPLLDLTDVTLADEDTNW